MKTVSDLIKESKSEQELKEVLNYANWTKPRGIDRRRFLQLAALKMRHFRENNGK